jgi:hypothetical protein
MAWYQIKYGFIKAKMVFWLRFLQGVFLISFMTVLLIVELAGRNRVNTSQRGMNRYVSCLIYSLFGAILSEIILAIKNMINGTKRALSTKKSKKKVHGIIRKAQLFTKGTF